MQYENQKKTKYDRRNVSINHVIYDFDDIFFYVNISLFDYHLLIIVIIYYQVNATSNDFLFCTIHKKLKISFFLRRYMYKLL